MKSFPQSSLDFAQMEARLLATISALCTERTPFENVEILVAELDAIRRKISMGEQFSLAVQLWSAYFQLVQAAPVGVKIDMDSSIRALNASLKRNSPPLVQTALSVIVSIVERIGFPASVCADRLNSLIIHSTSIPESVRLRALTCLNNALSVSSMLHEQFAKYATQLIDLLRCAAAPVPTELADLIISLLQTSCSLLRIPLLIDLQKQVCASALAAKPGVEVLKLLSALLEHNHEGVPLPIQIATSVFQRDYSMKCRGLRAVVLKGRTICRLIIRPTKVLCVKQQLQIADDTRMDGAGDQAVCSTPPHFGNGLAEKQIGQNGEIVVLNDETAAVAGTSLVENLEDGELNDDQEDVVNEVDDGEAETDSSEDVIMLVEDEEETYERNSKSHNLIKAAKRKNSRRMTRRKRTKMDDNNGAGGGGIERDFEHKTVDELLEDFIDE